MFRLDTWQEILSTMSRNLLRTTLTAFSIAWGIFILVMLMGLGEGFQNRVEADFQDDATNSMWVYRGKTSIPYEGMPVGRQIQFTDEDYELLKTQIEKSDHITGRFYPRGVDLVMRYGDKYGSFDMRCVHPDHLFLENTLITEGRFINELDLKEKRKVTCIGVDVRKSLFGEENPVGKFIEINGVPYRVIGLFEDEGAASEKKQVYVPITTGQQAFKGYNRIDQLMLTLGDATLEESNLVEAEIRELMARKHRFDPEDKRALFINNNLREAKDIRDVFLGIRGFMWFVGIGTILAGIVGISNIMLISVSERTKEIGVRKALGATPWSIITLIVSEAMLVTMVAGYAGLVLGVGLLEMINRFIPENDYVLNPGVRIGIVLGATLLLVIAGTLAGLFPARKAARLNPIIALRDE